MKKDVGDILEEGVNIEYTLYRRGGGETSTRTTTTGARATTTTTTNTTTGVTFNLPVLWLLVGPLSPCHAPVSIVDQLKLALLLCVVHAMHCAVSLPDL